MKTSYFWDIWAMGRWDFRDVVRRRVAIGDLCCACQAQDVPTKDWAKLAVKRCRANGSPNKDDIWKTMFWFGSARPH